MSRQHIHFVTGRLAEPSLRSLLSDLAVQVGFDYSVDVLPISVAALLTSKWAGPRMHVPSEATIVLLPGYCSGDIDVLESEVGVPVQRGPKDLRELPDYFGRQAATTRYGGYDIEILAEINHAHRLSIEELLAEAARLRADGADVMDLGCTPGETWREVGHFVAALKHAGHRLSIDSYDVTEIELAVRAGAELVLSVNASNREAARDWGCEVVAVPDVPGTLEGLAETVEFLDAAGVPLRIDPVLEPIGFGFARSLQRYIEARRRWPRAAMLMGIGNLTELTDADSAAMNVLLLGFCQEIGVQSVLTTQVINWARTSVRECDLARRLVYHAVKHRTLPKHVEPRLVTLRDPYQPERDVEEFDRLATMIRDHNFRLFAEGGTLHVVTTGIHLQGRDPFELFREFQSRATQPIDADHAFYLGYEMAKAATALTLHKSYRQDDDLDWGYLTAGERESTDARPPR